MNEKKDKVRELVNELLERADTEDLLYWSREYLTGYYSTHPEDFKAELKLLNKTKRWRK